MNDKPEQTKRIALVMNHDTALVSWIVLDQTGQPPRVFEEQGTRYELVSLDDSPISIYRADTGQEYPLDALVAFAELVRVVNGIPNVSADVDEQMRQLREQLRATVDNAETMIGDRDAQIEYDERRIEKIIESARGWKQRARSAEAEADTLHAAITSAEIRARTAERDRDGIEAKLDRALLDARRAHTLRREAQAAQLDSESRIVEVQANALDTINRVAAALPEPVIDAEVVTPDVVVDTWFGEDNVPVVQIDTECGHGRLRINLNDGVVWDGDPETDERPGAHAEPEEFSSEAARAADGATISRQLDTIRDQAARIEELQDALQRHVDSSHEVRTQDFANMREALGSGPGSDPILAARALRKARESLESERDDLSRRLTESETVRKLLDEQLATERRVYETTSAALRATLRQAYGVLDVAEHAIYPNASGSRKAEAIGKYRAARQALPALEAEADARDGGLIDVIRRYDGLAQIGANLARAVTVDRPDLVDIMRLARYYEQEHAKLKR